MWSQKWAAPHRISAMARYVGNRTGKSSSTLDRLAVDRTLNITIMLQNILIVIASRAIW